jgi:hypothetical protein
MGLEVESVIRRSWIVTRHWLLAIGPLSLVISHSLLVIRPLSFVICYGCRLAIDDFRHLAQNGR